MHVLVALVALMALVAGTFASPASKNDNVDNNNATPNVVDNSAWAPTVSDGRCDPCNDHMDKCMGKWPCWFYNCQPDCNKEVCEQLPDCRQGCGFHC